MIKIFLVLWLIVYCQAICKKLCQLYQLRKCVLILTDFIVMYDTRNPCLTPPNTDYQKELTALLRYYPVIAQYCRYPTLSYDTGEPLLRRNSEKIHSELMMIRNFKRHELFRALNPLSALKSLAVFPVSVIKSLGFQPKKLASLTIAIVGWAITFFLGLYSNEIKELLSLLFEKLS